MLHLGAVDLRTEAMSITRLVLPTRPRSHGCPTSERRRGRVHRRAPSSGPQLVADAAAVCAGYFAAFPFSGTSTSRMRP
jgi:hypothetical protein